MLDVLQNVTKLCVAHKLNPVIANILLNLQKDWCIWSHFKVKVFYVYVLGV
jgi:hypothetical protein